MIQDNFPIQMKVQERHTHSHARTHKNLIRIKRLLMHTVNDVGLSKEESKRENHWFELNVSNA